MFVINNGLSVPKITKISVKVIHYNHQLSVHKVVEEVKLGSQTKVLVTKVLRSQTISYETLMQNLGVTCTTTNKFLTDK